jgi:futalosine hydrolase
MEIVLVSATPFEIAPTLEYLQAKFKSTETGIYEKDSLKVRILVTGVGMVATSWQLGLLLAANRPGLLINAGIAGSLDPDIGIGSVVHVVSERFADLGVETADGQFSDLYEMGFIDPQPAWWQHGRLINAAAADAAFLPKVHGITVNKVHGAQTSIDRIRAKYPDAQVESMEGAAFFYACLQAGVPFLEIRSISNRVEPRNRDAWDIPGAIKALNDVIRQTIDV